MKAFEVFEWMLMVPDIVLWLTVIVSFVFILAQPTACDRNTWWGKLKLAIYVIQLILCVNAIIVLNMVD